MSDKELHEGPCVGGPMDGQNALSRFPEGFLLIWPDEGTGACVWIYDFKDGRFVCREDMPVEVDDEKAWRTANEPRYDVHAFDPETMIA